MKLFRVYMTIDRLSLELACVRSGPKRETPMLFYVGSNRVDGR
jgi:hypothetical protein